MEEEEDVEIVIPSEIEKCFTTRFSTILEFQCPFCGTKVYQPKLSTHVTQCLMYYKIGGGSTKWTYFVAIGLFPRK